MRYRLWILIAIILFAISLGIGLLLSAIMPANIVNFLTQILSSMKGLNLSPFQATTALYIFFKNASVLLLSFMFSPILCLTPILALAVNGILISFVSVIVARKESFAYVLAGILPHGILEIPAFIIGEAAALSFGVAAMIALFSREKENQLLPIFKQNLKYLVIAFFLLVPAAIIETYVTPLLLK